jgi:choline dehydrogenase-like flavoprotein
VPKTTEADVVVVGGGTAGCVLAARLSEDPSRSVCLVEAGPDYGPHDGGRWPADLLDGRTLAFSHSWERADETDRSQLRARVLGGCSAHNACVLLRGTADDYDEWGAGWTSADLDPYLARAEEAFGMRRFAEDELAPWQRAFAEAGAAAGLRGGPHPVNARASVRWNAAFAYLDAARARPNLTIAEETLVDRVLLRGGRARGVATSNGDVEADLTVLASGAYGSPAILLRSGIGPGGEIDLPVGENLRDHVGVGFGWRTRERLQEETAAYERAHTLFGAQVTLASERSELFVFPAQDAAAGGGYDFTGAVFAMKPRSTGRVTLSSDDPAAPPLIDHGFLSDARDVATLVDAVRLMRMVAATEPLRALIEAEERPGPDADVEAYVRAAARGFFHPVGTCALGTVLDRRGRVHGVDGLVVGDASLMPTLPRANTNLSAAAVAERIADLVDGRGAGL